MNQIRVKQDGKTIIVCPICGGICTEYAYNSFRHCTPCEKTIKQGNTPQQTRVLRANELREPVLEPEKLPSLSELEENYRKEQYDFLESFPEGIHVSSNNEKEASILRQEYEQYIRYNTLPEFHSIINLVLSMSLQFYRINLKLADPTGDLSASENGKLNEILSKLATSKQNALRTLDALYSERATRAQSIWISESSDILSYMAKNEHEYMGIGKCPNCGDKVTFKTYFPTFITRWKEMTDEIINSMIKSNKYDDATLETFRTNRNRLINEESFMDTYVAKWTRKIEEHLI